MKTIFIHIPKTGGTTLKDMLIRDFGPDNIYEDESDFGIPDIKNIKEEVICGHICFNYSLDGNNVITLLRNPVERIVSHYGHVLMNDHPSKEYAEKGLEHYAANPHHQQLDNGMIRQITGKMKSPIGSITRRQVNKAYDILNSFTVVGLLERFDEFVNALYSKGIIKSVDYEIKNKGSLDLEKIITSQAEEAIIRNNRFDIELYNMILNKK